MIRALTTLSRMPSSRPRAVYCRHAERGPIDDPTTGHSVLLTPKGRADARALGAPLAPFSPLWLYHSPVERCRETAEEIALGARSAGARAEVLGGHDGLGGPYLLKPKEALELARDLGAGYVRAWFDARLPAGLAKPLAEAADEQIGIVIEATQRAPAGLAVFVTHDWNVLAIREHLFGLRHEEHGWAGYLEGFAIALGDGGSTWACRDSVREIRA